MSPFVFAFTLGVSIVAACALPASAEVPRLTLSLTDGGVTCDCGSMGSFTLGYPSFQMNGSDDREPYSVSVDGPTARLVYDGATVTVTLGSGGGYLVDESGRAVRSFPDRISSVVYSGAPGSAGAKASVTAATIRTGAYYTLFTSTDLGGVFRAESSSPSAFDGAGLPVLVFSADVPVKFARIVVSVEPYASGTAYPDVSGE